MWVGLASWIVRDSPLPEVTVGSVLPGAAVGIIGDVGATTRPTQAALLGRVDQMWRFTGDVVDAPQEAVWPESASTKEWLSEFFLAGHDLTVRARARDLTADLLTVGQRLTLTGRANLLSKHEVAELVDAPEHFTNDWRVAGIRATVYQKSWAPRADGGYEGTQGETLNQIELPDLDVARHVELFERWEGRAGGRWVPTTGFDYLLDLAPTHRDGV